MGWGVTVEGYCKTQVVIGCVGGRGGLCKMPQVNRGAGEWVRLGCYLEESGCYWGGGLRSLHPASTSPSQDLSPVGQKTRWRHHDQAPQGGTSINRHHKEYYSPGWHDEPRVDLDLISIRLQDDPTYSSARRCCRCCQLPP